MDRDALVDLLVEVREGKLGLEAAVKRLERLPYDDLGFARVDNHRALRRGSAEAIFCAGKTTAQVVAIARRMVEYGHHNVLATRAGPEVLAALGEHVPVTVHADVRLAVINPMEVPLLGRVCVCTGGTSDMPVAEEAALTAEAGGSTVDRLYDVGVAGIHRLLDKRETLTAANVVVAVAGMEGALASVVAGLVGCPVIAVPTSVGYGANLGGIAALLTMLNSCSPGISVVNIDNGFGAGYQANVINQMVERGAARSTASAAHDGTS
jgi:hypothetical protein